jgi:hypothetical protein
MFLKARLQRIGAEGHIGLGEIALLPRLHRFASD